MSEQNNVKNSLAHTKWNCKYVLFYTCVEQLLRLFYASIFIFKQGKSGKEL